MSMTQSRPSAGLPARGPGAAMAAAAAPVEKAQNFNVSARRLLRQLAPQRFLVALILILASCGVALSVAGPKLLGNATNIIFAGFLGSKVPAGITQQQAVAGLRAQGQNSLADVLSGTPFVPGQGINYTALAHTLLLAVFVYVGASFFMWLQAYLLNGVVMRTVVRLRADVEEKLHALPLRYFDGRPRGEILSRVTNDIDNIQQTLQQTMSQLVNSVLTVIGVLLMMLWISPLLALISLISVPLTLIVARLVTKRSQPLFVAQWAETGRLNGHVEETYSGHTLVTVFGQQQAAQEEFDARNEKMYRASFGAQFLSGIIMPSVQFIGNLNYVLVAVVGGLKVASGALSLGAVQSFILYSRQFTMPLTQVASMANLVQSGVASAERVFDLLDSPDQSADASSPSLLSAPYGRVEFDHVSFRYEPNEPLIDDLSLVAEPGRTVAIVGPTGAGKTTLVNLLMRFYDLDGGRILLDGVDCATMTRAELRAQMGMVLQDTWLFAGTIRENIAYGRVGATEAQIQEAAAATFVDRFVHSLPDGYDTLIDDEGSNLSAGERQLVTIARAFLSDPTVLILDEATSSVDTRTELLLQEAMRALRTDRTSFVIAHRLSTIRDADLILVMEHGAIVEQGTHDELLDAEGAYFRLYNAQFVGAVADEEQ
jgi:ATP-binding cassette, subfamily B, multidrug efflux pump